MNPKSVYTADLLSAKRAKGDLPADELIRFAFSGAGQKDSLRQWLNRLAFNAQLPAVPQIFAGDPLISGAGRLPEWADIKLMETGAAFFARHARAIMNMLGLLSLPYCYAAANGAMVLYLSERMRTDAGTRLAETADCVWEVMAPDAFTDHGKGFAAILKVRLMHAAVRHYTFGSGKWDNATGQPINQEDMAGTNLSFSLIVIRGLRKFGYTIDHSDRQAFMHLWNVIGYLLGIDQELLPQTGKQAYDLEEAIRIRQFAPSVQGRELTSSLVKYFARLNTGGASPASEITQAMRYLLGDNIADMLSLPVLKLNLAGLFALKAITHLYDFKKNKGTAIVYKHEFYKFKQRKPVLG